jgi:hypothetical protein
VACTRSWSVAAVVEVDRDESLSDHRAGVAIVVDQVDRRRRVADTSGADGSVDPFTVHSRSTEGRQGADNNARVQAILGAERRGGIRTLEGRIRPYRLSRLRSFPLVSGA